MEIMEIKPAFMQLSRFCTYSLYPSQLLTMVVGCLLGVGGFHPWGRWPL
jgi:hypothetical protein